MLMVIHELNKPQRDLVLKEALRVASKAILSDATAPLPKNAGGIGIRFVEVTFGRDHHQNSKDFLAAGGLPGRVEGSGLPVRVDHSSVFWRDCREAVMVSVQ